MPISIKLLILYGCIILSNVSLLFSFFQEEGLSANLDSPGSWHSIVTSTPLLSFLRVGQFLESKGDGLETGKSTVVCMFAYLYVCVLYRSVHYFFCSHGWCLHVAGMGNNVNALAKPLRSTTWTDTGGKFIISSCFTLRLYLLYVHVVGAWWLVRNQIFWNKFLWALQFLRSL